MDFNAIWIFTQVVQSGSFTGAGRALGIPKSTISSKVAELEERLGVSLLKRTTRKLHLTEAGNRYFQVARRALTEIQEVETVAAQAQEQPKGLVRFTAPVEMGSATVSQLISRFLAEYPQIQIELILTDRIVDLVAENVDLALRAGALEDSTLIARKIGMTAFRIMASPQYLKRHGTPLKPTDLAEHECIRFTAPADSNTWRLARGGKTVQVGVKGRIAANNLIAIKELALAGQGLTLLPTFLCGEEVNDGRLIHLLPAWLTNSEPIHIVHASQKYLPPKTRLLADYLVTELKTWI